MCVSRVLQPQWPLIWTNILVPSHKTGMTHFTHPVMHVHLSYTHSCNIILTKKIPSYCLNEEFSPSTPRATKQYNKWLHVQFNSGHIDREFTAHSQTCLKDLTLPSLLATTPFLHTTLQLACLKVTGFRDQAHSNHRYALLCSAASTSCLGHTSLNPDCQESIVIVWWVSKQNWRGSSLETP